MKDTQKNYMGLFTKLITNPSLYLMAKNAELDFIFFDNEHSVFSKTKLHDLILFGNNIGIPSFVRVGELSRREVCQALDSGATGVMVPMIETQQQAEDLVSWSKYPPFGTRSYSGGANTNYGPSGGHAENMKSMNETCVTIAQIETQKGIDNAEAIIKTKGIDGVIVGPIDLSISMGNVGNIMDPNELRAIGKIISLFKQYNKTVGIIGTNQILEYYKDSLNYFVSAIDANIMRDGMKEAVRTYRMYVPEGVK